MRLALAQMNTVVGDVDGNAARIAERLDEARNAGADLVLFPELAVTGYPPEDLLLRPAFVRAARRSVEELAIHSAGITALVGAPHLDADLFNACYVLAGGEIRAVYRKLGSGSTRPAGAPRTESGTEHPDPVDEQLTWLRDAGFAHVDCLWKKLGRALIVGYK